MPEENSLRNIDFVILAGGKGSRIRKYLGKYPKPMLKINNKHFIMSFRYNPIPLNCVPKLEYSLNSGMILFNTYKASVKLLARKKIQAKATNINVILTSNNLFSIGLKDLIFSEILFFRVLKIIAKIRYDPCNPPQIINVQFAPCHKPLSKKVIIIL